MIDNFRVKLHCETGTDFKGCSGYHVYACLMEMLSEETAEYLHLNEKTPLSQNIEFSKSDSTAVWNINSFDERISAELENALEKQSEFLVEKIGTVLHKDSLERKRISGFAELRKETDGLLESGTANLGFATTTALKKNGKFLLFPDMELILKNLWNSWNNIFPEQYLEDEDALKLLLMGTYITSYELSSSHYKMKGNAIRGFYGRITVGSRLSVPMKELFCALLALSQYSGTGVKTALGMGKTILSEHNRNHPHLSI